MQETNSKNSHIQEKEAAEVEVVADVRIKGLQVILKNYPERRTHCWIAIADINSLSAFLQIKYLCHVPGLNCVGELSGMFNQFE